MCEERWRTRDRLLEYDSNIMPPRPHSAGLSMIYPWENINLTNLAKAIYQIAINHGFTGTENNFWEKFTIGTGTIVTGIVATFPVPGEEDTLYLDLQTDILYYFKETTSFITPTEAIQYGIEIVGISQDNSTQYLYIPIRAMLMEDTILNCGDAAEYID